MVAVCRDGTSPPAPVRRHATERIPVVAVFSSDPVAAGLVHSYARPGGNVTGVTAHAPGLGGRRLQLLKEAFPALHRVTLLQEAGWPDPAAHEREVQQAAQALEVQLQALTAS